VRELTSGQRLPYDDFFSYFLVRIQESDTYHFLENRAINWNLNSSNDTGRRRTEAIYAAPGAYWLSAHADRTGRAQWCYGFCRPARHEMSAATRRKLKFEDYVYT